MSYLKWLNGSSGIFWVKWVMLWVKWVIPKIGLSQEENSNEINPAAPKNPKLTLKSNMALNISCFHVFIIFSFFATKLFHVAVWKIIVVAPFLVLTI